MTAEHPTQIAVAIVELHDRVIVGRRPPGAALAGLWEFPGGKVEFGETPARAAWRECLEETGLDVDIGDCLLVEPYEYEHGSVEIYFFRARATTDHDPAPPFVWHRRSQLATLQFPPANTRVLALLL